MKKFLSIILMLAMLVPMMSVFASAADLVNLYDASKAVCGTPNATQRDTAPTYNANYYCSAPIEVKAGDVVTVGPVFIGQGYYFTSFNADGSVKTNQIKYADCTKVDEIMPGVEIVKWTVPEGTAAIRMATSQMFVDCTLITVNQEFDKAGYFAAMDKAGVNIDMLRPTNAQEKLVNIFPKADTTYLGRVDKSNKEIAADQYRTCPAVPVKEGDVIYFIADLAQSYQLVLLDAEGKGTTTVNKNYMVEYANFGDGYGIYSYRMRPGTAYVRVIAATKVYDAETLLVTINQPFDAEGYNNFLNPPAETEPAPETTEPATPPTTGDSTLVFAAIAVISLVGVAVVSKRKEN